MELTFGDEALAETCNDRRLMLARWGDEGFRCLARRLLELDAALNVAEIEGLPELRLRRGKRGAVRLDFASGETVIRAVLHSPGPDGAPVCMRITGVDVNMPGVSA